jgi:hypothetical protein
MTAQRLAALLMIGGSVVFGVGAAIGVPAVFTERDPAVRLRLLQDNVSSWRLAQPLYALGPLLVAAGVGVLATYVVGRGARVAIAIAFVALLLGSIAWAMSVYTRAFRITEFASGTLPAWPFTTYVLLTIAGIASLAIGLLAERFPGWIVWVTLGADLVFLAGYLWFKDIPPFVFYLLFSVIGLVAW